MKHCPNCQRNWNVKGNQICPYCECGLELGEFKEINTRFGLDFEIVFSDGEWHVWTPDTTGAILGSGDTKLNARADAVKNMEHLCAVLMGSIVKP